MKLGPAPFDRYVLSFDETGLVQSLDNRASADIGRVCRQRKNAENSHYRHRLLLCTEDSRRSHRCAEHEQQFSPLHPIARLAK
jgi:hypothetical protein